MKATKRQAESIATLSSWLGNKNPGVPTSASTPTILRFIVVLLSPQPTAVIVPLYVTASFFYTISNSSIINQQSTIVRSLKSEQLTEIATHCPAYVNKAQNRQIY
jgi:hypothetical protein